MSDQPGTVTVDRYDVDAVDITARAENRNVIAEFTDDDQGKYFLDVRRWLLRAPQPQTADHYRTLSRWADTVAAYLAGEEPEGDVGT